MSLLTYSHCSLNPNSWGMVRAVLLSSRALTWALAVSGSFTRKAAQRGWNVLLEPWPFLLRYCEKLKTEYSFICIQPGCSAFRPPFLSAADRMSQGSDMAVTLCMSWSTSIRTWFLSSNESSHRSSVWEKSVPRKQAEARKFFSPFGNKNALQCTFSLHSRPRYSLKVDWVQKGFCIIY